MGRRRLGLRALLTALSRIYGEPVIWSLDKTKLEETQAECGPLGRKVLIWKVWRPLIKHFIS